MEARGKHRQLGLWTSNAEEGSGFPFQEVEAKKVEDPECLGSRVQSKEERGKMGVVVCGAFKQLRPSK